MVVAVCRARAMAASVVLAFLTWIGAGGIDAATVMAMAGRPWFLVMLILLTWERR